MKKDANSENEKTRQGCKFILDLGGAATKLRGAVMPGRADDRLIDRFDRARLD